MRDFIRERQFNSFSKLPIVSHFSDVDVNKIILFGTTLEIHTVVPLFIIMLFLSQHFSLQVLITQFRLSHDCPIKFFAHEFSLVCS